MRRCKITAGALVLALAGSGAFADEPPFLVVAHRGGLGPHPENTLPACLYGLDQGANALEVDVGLTRDDRIVLWHDPCHSKLVSSARELDLEGQEYRPWVPPVWSRYRTGVHELDLATFRKHHGYTRDSGWRALANSSRRAPYEVPTLEELADWARGEARLAMLFLDVKIERTLDSREGPCGQPDDLALRFARRARAVLEPRGLLERTVFMCPSRGTLRTLQRELRGTAARFSFDQEIPAVLPSVGSHSAVLPALEEGCDFASIGRPVGLRAFEVYRQVLARDLSELASRRSSLARVPPPPPGPVRGVPGRGVAGALARLESQEPGFDDLVPLRPPASKPRPSVAEVPSSTPPAIRQPRLVAWTVNDERELRELIAMGIDAVLTDHPARLAGLLHGR